MPGKEASLHTTGMESGGMHGGEGAGRMGADLWLAVDTLHRWLEKKGAWIYLLLFPAPTSFPVNFPHWVFVTMRPSPKQNSSWIWRSSSPSDSGMAGPLGHFTSVAGVLQVHKTPGLPPTSPCRLTFSFLLSPRWSCGPSFLIPSAAQPWPQSSGSHELLFLLPRFPTFCFKTICFLSPNNLLFLPNHLSLIFPFPHLTHLILFSLLEPQMSWGCFVYLHCPSFSSNVIMFLNILCSQPRLSRSLRSGVAISLLFNPI